MSIPYAKLQAVAEKAIKADGAIVRTGKVLTEVNWTIAGSCDAPRPRTLAACSTSLHVLRVHLMTRCRKCEPCKRWRAINWRDRVQYELANSQRSWFGTYTFTMLQQWAFDLAIAKEYERCGHSFPKGKRLYEERCKQAGKLMTKFIKRLREDVGERRLRYVMVAERHKSGRPHFHVMLHETNGPIGKREISLAWHQGYPDQVGFIKNKLVDTGDETSVQRSAWYICKYLTKEAGIRMRASFKYGKPAENVLQDITQQPMISGGVLGGGRSPPLSTG